ncbi:uncharacterized protein LOC121367085, partial [Gigantopelta aegis]|uniref:uncharacterized protein LOC121367085 n=1 Tax=Gigantopelta aegis TaxID=1735272 RepID=UPI001B88BEA4
MAASSADNVAESFVTAINNHQKSNPSICDVRIIIFQPDMLQSFTDTIQKALGQKAGKPGFWHTVTDTVKGFIGYGSKHEETSLPSASDDSSEVSLYYFSDDYTSIDGCIQAVDSYCRDETIKKVIADEALEHLNQSQRQKVYSLRNEFQVSVTFQQNLGQITIEGMQQDVYNAFEVVQKLLRDVD